MAQPVSADVQDDVADGDLVARCLRGQREAFEPLFDRYARQVYTIAYRLSGNATEAEDLTQDAFLQAFRNLHTLQQPQAFASWLYHIATNTCLDRLRRRKLPQAELTETIAETYPDQSHWHSPHDVVMRNDDRGAVWAALARLAPSQRAALILRESHGLSYAAIAAALGISTGAVEVLIFRARRRFREHYEKMADGAAHAGNRQPAWCPQTPAALAAVLDTEGPAAERAAVLAHARTCPICHAETTAQRAARKARAALPLLPLPAALKPQILPHLIPVGGASIGTAATVGSAGGSAGSAATTAASAGSATMTAASAGSAATTAATTAGSMATTTATTGSATAMATTAAATTGSVATAAAGAVATGAGAAAVAGKIAALVLAAGVTTAAIVTTAVHTPRPHHVPTAASAAHIIRPASPTQRSIALGVVPQRQGVVARQASHSQFHTRQAPQTQAQPHVQQTHAQPHAQQTHAKQAHTATTRPRSRPQPARVPITRPRPHVQHGHTTTAPQTHPHVVLGHAATARPHTPHGRAAPARSPTRRKIVAATQRRTHQKQTTATRPRAQQKRTTATRSRARQKRTMVMRSRSGQKHAATAQPRAHVHRQRRATISRQRPISYHTQARRTPAHRVVSRRRVAKSTHRTRRHTAPARPRSHVRQARRHRQRHVPQPAASQKARPVRQARHNRPQRSGHSAQGRGSGPAGHGHVRLRVTWPRGRVLHYDRKEKLHLTTLPGATVSVTLRIVREEVGRPRQPGAAPTRIRLVYHFTAHAHAGRHGRATVLLRYAYVPPRPLPATLTVVARTAHDRLQRSVRVRLVRQ